MPTLGPEDSSEDEDEIIEIAQGHELVQPQRGRREHVRFQIPPNTTSDDLGTNHDHDRSARRLPRRFGNERLTDRSLFERESSHRSPISTPRSASPDSTISALSIDSEVEHILAGSRPESRQDEEAHRQRRSRSAGPVLRGARERLRRLRSIEAVEGWLEDHAHGPTSDSGTEEASSQRRTGRSLGANRDRTNPTEILQQRLIHDLGPSVSTGSSRGSARSVGEMSNVSSSQNSDFSVSTRRSVHSAQDNESVNSGSHVSAITASTTSAHSAQDNQSEISRITASTSSARSAQDNQSDISRRTTSTSSARSAQDNQSDISRRTTSTSSARSAQDNQSDISRLTTSTSSARSAQDNHSGLSTDQDRIERAALLHRRMMEMTRTLESNPSENSSSAQVDSNSDVPAVVATTRDDTRLSQDLSGSSNDSAILTATTPARRRAFAEEYDAPRSATLAPRSAALGTSRQEAPARRNSEPESAQEPVLGINADTSGQSSDSDAETLVLEPTATPYPRLLANTNITFSNRLYYIDLIERNGQKLIKIKVRKFGRRYGQFAIIVEPDLLRQILDILVDFNDENSAHIRGPSTSSLEEPIRTSSFTRGSTVYYVDLRQNEQGRSVQIAKVKFRARGEKVRWAIMVPFPGVGDFILGVEDIMSRSENLN